jgi:hypothetical protein
MPDVLLGPAGFPVSAGTSPRTRIPVAAGVRARHGDHHGVPETSGATGVATDVCRPLVPADWAGPQRPCNDPGTGAISDAPGHPRRAGARAAEHTAGRRRPHGPAGCHTPCVGSPGGGASMSAGTGSAVSWLSFGRIIDVPFEVCVAALESWPRTGQDGELRIGQSLLRRLIEHARDWNTCQIEVGLARRPLRPPRRMRLEINRWHPPSSRTALELIPCQRVRPTAAYFRSGHLLLDSLTHSLLQYLSAQHLGHVPAVPPACGESVDEEGVQRVDEEGVQQVVTVDEAALLGAMIRAAGALTMASSSRPVAADAGEPGAESAQPVHRNRPSNTERIPLFCQGTWSGFFGLRGLAATRAGVGWWPGSGVASPKSWRAGCEPVALESESFPGCPPGPACCLVRARRASARSLA